MTDDNNKKRSPVFIAVPILGAISVCHMLNDMIQALLPAIYPILKSDLDLSFTQIGLLTLAYQFAASLLQPLVGSYMDRQFLPYALPFGMAISLMGLLTLAFAPQYGLLLAGATLVGFGSCVFHPEASRVARQASGGAHGLAQSIFQVGGNFGSALGPLAAAFVVLPHGRHGLSWFIPMAFCGIVLLGSLDPWRQRNNHLRKSNNRSVPLHSALPNRQAIQAMLILIMILFSKYIYLSSITNYYTFYLIQRFDVSIQTAQISQFLFLSADAAGAIIGGILGDRFGRKLVIIISVLGILPFTLLLPYTGFLMNISMSVIIGLVLSSAFPAIIIFAQDLIPGRVGMVSGLFFGLIFGVGGISAAFLGGIADQMGISFVYKVCSFLPLIGLSAILLPDIRNSQRDFS